jgi:hypothetical protein
MVGRQIVRRADVASNPPQDPSRVVLAGYGRRGHPEPGWELLHDAIRQGVRHVEDVVGHRVEGAHITVPVRRGAKTFFILPLRDVCGSAEI